MPISLLNAEQRAAASAPRGYNLIIASAGTGKTSTIVGRIAHLLQSGVAPKEILLLTFTNKASQEMIERVGKFFSPKVAGEIESGTFHAVAYRYLKQHSQIRLKQPKELKVLFKSLYEKRVFLNRSSQPPYSSQYLYDIYSLFVNSSFSGSFGEWITKRQPQQEDYTAIYEDVLAEFSELKKAHHYADYNDLLLLYREAISQKTPDFVEVLCDEYQDTNPLQDSILKALQPKSLFCVGDYDQSIYAFNGADISIISSFASTYENARVFSLSKNYRSSAQILALANKVIEHNERIYPKKLEVVKSGNFEAPKLLGFDELFLQYQGIAQAIAQSKHTHSDIAIIFRNNSSADGLEASLRTLNIPCKRKGSSSFFESKEVVLLLDLCAIITHKSDMMAYINALSYGKGIGSAVARDLFESLLRLGEGNALQGLFAPNLSVRSFEQKAKNTQLGLFDDFFALQAKERFNALLDKNFASHPLFEHPKLNAQSAEFLNEFYLLLSQTKEVKVPKHLILQISQSTFFQKIMQTLAIERAKNKDGSIDSQREEKAKENIARKISLLHDLARSYQDMPSFLNAMVLISTEASEGNGVNLLSVHASKGLEFRDVYVVDLMEGRFPNIKLVNKGGSIEEERRLFYVALTRAKENLILSYALKDALKNIDYAPSRFLYEANLLQKGSETS
ncbi:ATP-dependent DNA helicase [Helicobacter sp. MIT 00-7814]|uniref:ATP-dependent helicase n=1 Tax=unclassified Helicobacter TaxID=2593540 RepID=UPI000E1F951C|nr:MULTISPECIES: ATP-dependent helicase [unclassified Helicobacter]RDU53308.1 ATP-dependent DNA helicase [Helicobacter sp. MIT 99-10781]RDU56939.1 ATP-dependent DNA helicase [Helicobacter sp. MIT 00-7814]